MPVNTITTMNLTELCNKYTPGKSEILLEFSPAKTESLVNHFLSKHPEITPEAIKFIVDRYSTLLTTNDRTGQPVLLAANGERDIDGIIAKDNGDGWSVVFELVSDNTIPTGMPESITQIPGNPALIIDEGGIKVYRTDTYSQCAAIRSVIFGLPAFKAVYDALPNEEKNAPGRHPFGWCVTHKTSHYYNYRAVRSFYFVLDTNRPVTDRWCISVVQPIKNSNSPMITDMRNSDDDPSNGHTTWNFIYNLYPVLRAHQQQFSYNSIHPAEQAQFAFRGLAYYSLDEERAKRSDSYLYRWYTVNPDRGLPLNRFLTLGREYQDNYLASRLPRMFITDPNNKTNYGEALFMDSVNQLRPLSFSEIFKQLLDAGKVGVVKRIVALYSQQINVHTLDIDAEGLPILLNNAVSVIAEPIIIERLPGSRKYIYGKLLNDRTPMIYIRGDDVGDPRHKNIKRSVTAEDLVNPDDKKIYDELVYVLHALRLFYKNKTV